MAADASYARAQRPPWPVKAYFPATLGWVLAFSWPLETGAHVAQVLSGLLIPVAVAIGLWRRGKPAWYIGVALNVIGVVLGAAVLLGGNRDIGLFQITGAAFLLWLLLHEDTRRWCGH